MFNFININKQLGRKPKGGKQRLSLGKRCINERTPIHELMHALGKFRKCIRYYILKLNN